MAVRYLLDTNIASYAIKGAFSGIRDRLLEVPMPEVGVSVITEAELRFGVARRTGAPNLRLAVEEFLARVEILAWESEAAQCYATVRAELEARGRPMGNMDMMIAAQALAAQATLVTHDRVFRSVRQLKLEDWTK